MKVCGSLAFLVYLVFIYLFFFFCQGCIGMEIMRRFLYFLMRIIFSYELNCFQHPYQQLPLHKGIFPLWPFLICHPNYTFHFRRFQEMKE